MQNRYAVEFHYIIHILHCFANHYAMQCKVSVISNSIYSGNSFIDRAERFFIRPEDDAAFHHKYLFESGCLKHACGFVAPQ